MGQTCGHGTTRHKIEYTFRSKIWFTKLVYTVLMRPKIRPKHVSAVTQRHVKNRLCNRAQGYVPLSLIHIYVYMTEYRSPSENLIKSNDEY